jgi:plastocyanin
MAWCALAFLVTVFAALWSTTALAAPLSVRLVDASNHPVRDAVVVADLPGAHAMPVGHGYSVRQKDLAFQPFVLVIPAGATVSFPNGDNTRHQVYSFSPTKRFELKLFARDQTRSIVFERPGVVALGCNIHDRMSAFVFVAENAWTVRSDEHGVATIPDAPNSGGTLRVWHPYLHAPNNMIVVPIVAGQRSVSVKLQLRTPPVRPSSGY